MILNKRQRRERWRHFRPGSVTFDYVDVINRIYEQNDDDTIYNKINQNLVIPWYSS